MGKGREVELEEIYRRIPDVKCRGLCQSYCGPIPMTQLERKRIIVQIGHAPKADPQTMSCNMLTPEGRCGCYSVRPLVCFLPSAWVFTPQGPRRISSILAGDQVYGADGRIRRVLATATRIYEGRIHNVRFTGTHIPCWATEDHPWLVATQKDKRKRPAPYWIASSQIVPKKQHAVGDYLTFPRDFQDVAPAVSLVSHGFSGGEFLDGRMVPMTSGRIFEGKMEQSIPEEFTVDDEFLFMLGLYLAEGGASNQSACFTMHMNERKILDRVEGYLNSHGIRTHRTSKRKTIVLRVDSCLFARMMKSLAGDSSSTKRVNPKLFGKLSHRQKFSIYRAWNVGDGRKCIRENEFSTTTISEELAVQMTFIAMANRLFPRTYKSDKGKRDWPSYDVHLFPSNWNKPSRGHGTKNMSDGTFIYSPAAALETSDYSGPVVDIQVEDSESFVTTSGIAHNCRLWGAIRAIQCPYGCVPDRWLTVRDVAAMVVDVRRVGGPDVVDPMTAEIFRRNPGEWHATAIALASQMENERDP